MTTKHRRTQYTFTLTTLHYQSNTMKLHACNLFTTEKMFTNYDFQITFNYDNQPDPMSLWVISTLQTSNSSPAKIVEMRFLKKSVCLTKTINVINY